MPSIEKKERFRRHPYGIAIIGTGEIGQRQVEILQASQSHHYKLVATSDVENERLTSMIPHYQNVRHIMENPSVEAVMITTPPRSRAADAFLALSKGKHVALETPPAIDLESLFRPQEQARSIKRTLYTLAPLQYSLTTLKAKELLANEKIKNVSLYYREDVRSNHDETSQIFDREKSGGGVLMTRGFHALSVITSILPTTQLYVREAFFKVPLNFSVEQSAEVDFIFNFNGKGHLDMNWFSQGEKEHLTTFTTIKGEKYEIDTNRDCISKDGHIIYEAYVGRRQPSDVAAEYDAVFNTFFSLMQKHQSVVHTTELKFILDAYSRNPSFSNQQNPKR